MPHLPLWAGTEGASVTTQHARHEEDGCNGASSNSGPS